jgi:hypothetical protein
LLKNPFFTSKGLFMASTTFLQQAYLAYFGRPADAAGLLTFANASESSVIASFSASAESQQFFGSMDTFKQINTIYKNLFNREAEPAGLNHWAGKIISGEVTLAAAAMEILKNAQNSDKLAVTNKLAASSAFTAAIDTTAEIIGYSGAAAIAPARAYLAAVTSDAATLTAATAAAALDASIASVVSAGSSSVGQTLSLTTGADNLTGTTSNDTFTARVVQNNNGEQTNQLATGDQINGGAGTDTLSAKIIAASALNQGPVTAIAPETVAVEKVAFTALTTATSAGDINPKMVEVNAKFMNGLTTISSVQSDASLLVSNVNTLKDDGLYANKRLTESLTVRMDHSGNDAVISESDMAVLIDNDYLLRGNGTASAALTVALSPQLEVSKGYDSAKPLQFNPFDKLSFKIDGVSYEITIGTGTANKPVTTTYADLKAAIQAGLTAKGLTDVVLTQNVGAYTYYSRDGVQRTADTFTFAKAGSILTSQGAGAWIASSGLPDDNSFGATVITADTVTTKSQITVNVELEKVGRGSDGGDLTIGGMATDGNNKWDFSSSKTLEEGVEKFNVKVSGDATQFSSLASLQSTNNTLQTVVVTSATGSKADLVIGNHNTEGAITNALKDVRDFDASAFANNVTLNAHVSDESVAKYMKLKDESVAAPAADNANFAYNFGAGNDTLNLNISKANLSAAGGTTTREDFSMAISTGAGNDKVTVQIGDGQGVATDAWFINSNLNRNLSINAGAGDDTVSAKGAGTWTIAAGEGADTVYSDNTGKKAIWVLNTTNQTLDSAAAITNIATAKAAYKTALDAHLALLPGNTEATFNALPTTPALVNAISAALSPVVQRTLENLVSDNNDASLKLFKATATVDYQGFSKAVTIDSTNYLTSDLQINQAIKKAINSDAVLSKLLLATDGPANTLVITSLVDGAQVDTAAGADLTVTIASAKATEFSDVELAALITAGYVAAGSTKADVVTAINAAANAVNGPNADYAAKFAHNGKDAVYSGSNSNNATLNIIEGAAGNDVIVTGTGTDSKDTVVYNNLFDKDAVDTIVNFDATKDMVSFLGYGLKAWIVDNTGGADVQSATYAGLVAGDKYVLLTESTTNDGSYVATVYTENGATDTAVGVIGTLDFGVEQVFTSFNV